MIHQPVTKRFLFLTICALLISAVAPRAFADGPDLPILDISQEFDRHTVIANTPVNRNNTHYPQDLVDRKNMGQVDLVFIGDSNC